MRGLLKAMLLAMLLFPTGPASAIDPFAVGFQPPDDARLPGEAALVDHNGAPMRLEELIGGPPLILAPVYYTCPNICGVTLDGLFDALGHVPLQPGRDFRVLTLSIHPEEGSEEARAARREALARFSGELPGDAVRFLTGSEAEIAAVMQAVGFGYRWDPERQEFAHPAGVIVATGDGRVARWLPGVAFQPSDLRLAVLEAGEGRVGSLTDRLLLLCYHYDPASGQYNSIVQGSLQIAGTVTVLALAGFIGHGLLRDRAARHRQGDASRLPREDG